MEQVISEAAPLAIGVALSPIPIAAVIVMLSTANARANASAFVVAWVLGILAVGLTVFAIPGLETNRGDPTKLSGAIRCALGLLLIALAWKQWRTRPAGHEDAKVPAWMAKLDSGGVGQSAWMGFLLSAVNPKNLVLTGAAAAVIDASRLDPMQQFLTLLSYAGLASVTVAVPVMGFFVFGRRAEATLNGLKDWLIDNNATVMTVLLVVLAAVVLIEGVEIVNG